MKRIVRGDTGGGATDFYGIAYHGQASTHLDALCHVWDNNGMWNGRNPDEVITFDGAQWGSVEHWKDGIITRGVLLDVPRHRGEPFVTMDKPIHGWELEDIAKAEGITMEPGDALLVYGGRDNWDRVNPTWGSDPQGRPGLHASCLKFIRESDCCLLVWDMMDFMPNGYEFRGQCTVPSSHTVLACSTMPCCNPSPRYVPRRDATSSCSPSLRCASSAAPARRSIRSPCFNDWERP